MRLYIKNMMTLRCKLMVRQELEKLNIVSSAVELGYADLESVVPKRVMQALQANLRAIGLEIVGERRQILVGRIKGAISESLVQKQELPKLTYSNFLEQQIELPYAYLSKIFKEETGMTLAKYLICFRIEQVKELLELPNASLTDIAFRLHYCSVAHLSRQFKDVTGQCVTSYMHQKQRVRLELDRFELLVHNYNFRNYQN